MVRFPVVTMASTPFSPFQPDCTGCAPAVVLLAGDPALAALAVRGLSIGAELPVVEQALPGSLVLTEGPEGLELRDADEAPGRGVRCDWSWLAVSLRTGAGLRRHPLAKAIGSMRTIIDATAGLGDDALLMAALGCSVIAYERSPAVWALLDDALLRAAMDPILRDVAQRIELRKGDATVALRRLAEPPTTESAFRPDGVLIDPMYPPRRRRSALPRKGMQVLRRVVGPDLDAAALLDAALAVATQRVIVKRLDDGPPLREPIDFSIGSRTVRCDVYRPRGAQR